MIQGEINWHESVKMSMRTGTAQMEGVSRLERMSANQRERLARESQDECEGRLVRINAN